MSAQLIDNSQRANRTAQAPSGETTAFQSFIAGYFEEYRPKSFRERELVQSLAETRWRLNRIADLEMALLEPTSLSEGDAPTAMASFLKYEKQLRTLHTQEARLNRRFDQELKELRDLQRERERNSSLDFEAARAEIRANHPEWVLKPDRPRAPKSKQPKSRQPSPKPFHLSF